MELDFDQRPTIFVGDNAVGKSNILEAAYFLSTTKSQRVDEEGELIKQWESVARVEGEIEEMKLEITLQKTDEQFSKRVKVNGIPKRAVDYIGNLPAVIFYPSDINMVTGSPSLRRWHLDLSLAQIDPEYKKALTLYEQFLTARNRVLKAIREGKAKIDELDYWTQELVKQGEVVSGGRKAFLESMNNFHSPLGNFLFEYRQSELSHERLKHYNGREIQASVTLIGPHRDDFEVFLEGRNLAHFGSRGEQRTATLAFKLAQLEYMAKILSKSPILLLDDVFSELDASHRAHVVAVVGRQQTIIATVELENLPKEFLSSARILRVKEGKIIF